MAEKTLDEAMKSLALDGREEATAAAPPESGQATPADTQVSRRRGRRSKKKTGAADSQASQSQNEAPQPPQDTQTSNTSGAAAEGKAARASAQGPGASANNKRIDSRQNSSAKPSRQHQPRNQPGRPSPANAPSTAQARPLPVRPKDRSLYIVANVEMGPNNKVLGVYSNLPRANAGAFNYLQTECGIPTARVTDKLGMFGQIIRRNDSARDPPLAGKRYFADGTLMILDEGGHSWVQVMRKDPGREPTAAEEGQSFLALDGTFVIGAFWSKDEAWASCKEYWAKLSYSIPVEDMTQWVDTQGMYHARGRIGGVNDGRYHHWFVQGVPVL